MDEVKATDRLETRLARDDDPSPFETVLLGLKEIERTYWQTGRDVNDRIVAMRNVSRRLLDAYQMPPVLHTDPDLAALRDQLDEVIRVLRRHHEWHMTIGTVCFPSEDGDGDPVELDLSAEYMEGSLYDATVAVLPPEEPEAGS